MRLSQDQVALFERDGFLLLPDLFDASEVRLLRDEVERLNDKETDAVFRRSEVSTVYRVHERDGDTGSELYYAAARLARVLEPMQQILGRDELYVYNSKVNCKKAVAGFPMLWHQDYGYWKLDRVPAPNMATFMIALGAVNEIAGELYVIPGSHKLGLLRHKPQMIGDHKQVAIDRVLMCETLRELAEPVPLRGEAGLCAIFHANTIHGSGHNLSGEDRWQCYFAYNSLDNKPGEAAFGRPDYMVSRNFEPLTILPDNAILTAARETA